MTDGQQHSHRDVLAKAKEQLAAATAEFQKGLSAVKDPARRRELTVSYVELMQRYLAKAQEGLDKVKAHQQKASSGSPSGSLPAEGSGDPAGSPEPGGSFEPDGSFEPGDIQPGP